MLNSPIVNLARTAYQVQRLLKTAEEICPEVVPRTDEALSDSRVLDVLKHVARTCRIGELGNLDEVWSFEETYWIYELVSDALDRDEALKLFLKSVSETSGEILQGIYIWPPVYDFDDLDEAFRWGEVPLSVCIQATEHFCMVDPIGVFNACLGDADGNGVIAASIAPMIKGYRQKIRDWETANQALNGMKTMPLVANLAWDWYVPGIGENAFLGGMARTHEESNPLVCWVDIPELVEQLHVSERVALMTRSLSTLETFLEILRTFKLKDGVPDE